MAHPPHPLSLYPARSVQQNHAKFLLCIDTHDPNQKTTTAPLPVNRIVYRARKSPLHSLSVVSWSSGQSPCSVTIVRRAHGQLIRSCGATAWDTIWSHIRKSFIE